jgi:hypothetical protein
MTWNAKEYNQTWKRQNRARIYAKAKEARMRNPVKYLLFGVRGRAVRFGIECSLTEADLVVPETCPVLGIPLLWGQGPSANNSPSVDRFDNSKAYTKDNIHIISNRANKLKNNATVEEMRAVLRYMEAGPSPPPNSSGK